MRKPTLEEVKEYFKDAITVMPIDETTEVDITKNIVRKIHEWYSCYWIDISNYKGDNVLLWDNKKGYAKILTYKTPRFEISKETILKYNMKDEFPEVFEVELKINTWYKFTKGTIGFYQGENKISYGIHAISKEWFSDHLWFANHNLKDVEREATPEEVKEALKSEWRRLGGENSCVYIESIKGICNIEHNRASNYYYYADDSNILFYKGMPVFSKGVFAKLIPTITKAEAERQLNAKII